jgi:hypothetical protein
LEQEIYAAVRFDRLLPHGGLRSMKFGWVTSYLESVILASWISIMSVVVPVLFSSVLMAVELQFALWDMSHMVAANELYLLIGVHGIAVISGVVSLAFCSGFLPGISDGLVLDRASGVEGRVFYVHVAYCSAVTAFVGGMGAGFAQAVWVFQTLVFLGRVVACAEATNGAAVVSAGGLVVSKLLASSALVN